MTEDQALEALRAVVDPEVGLDIVELGLVYRVVASASEVVVTMTLTTPGCPLHDALVGGVRTALARAGAPEVHVRVVWDPPWTPQRIGAAGRSALASAVRPR